MAKKQTLTQLVAFSDNEMRAMRKAYEVTMSERIVIRHYIPAAWANEARHYLTEKGFELKQIDAGVAHKFLIELQVQNIGLLDECLRHLIKIYNK